MLDKHIHLPDNDASLSNVTLYINTAIIIGNHIYFTTCNENKLFKTDFNGNVEMIASLPVLSNGKAKFQSMQYVDDKIWKKVLGKMEDNNNEEELEDEMDSEDDVQLDSEDEDDSEEYSYDDADE